MKKVLLILISIIFVLSCNKFEIPETINNDKTYKLESDEKEHSENAVVAKNFSGGRKFKVSCDGIPGCPDPIPFCDGPGQNCPSRDVIIKGIKLSGIDEAIETNNQTTFFSQTLYTDIFDFLDYDDNIQNNLINGDYKFLRIINTSTGLVYYLLVSSNCEINYNNIDECLIWAISVEVI